MQKISILMIFIFCGLIWSACDSDSDDESAEDSYFSREDYFVIGAGETLFYPLEVADEGILTVTFPLEVTAIDWSISGRESALINFYLDGRYVADAVAVGTPFGFMVRAILGEVAIGSHEMRITYNKALSPAKDGLLAIAKDAVELAVIAESDERYRMVKYAPLFYGRGYYDTRDEPVNTFSDAPVALLCDIYDATNYSYIDYYVGTTNVDSGDGIYPRIKLAQDGTLSHVARLMSYQFEPDGELIAERIWTGGTFVIFNGEYLDSHPILKITGDDNTVSDSFVLEDYDEPRFFPMPVTVNPLVQSFSTMLEQNVTGIDWMTAVEVDREGKIVYTESGDPIVGSTTGTLVADLRNYVYFELFATGSMVQSSLAVEILLENNDIYQSDYYDVGGEAEYLIGSGGMVHTAVELPVDVSPLDIEQIRVVYRPRTAFTGGYWKIYEVDAFILDENYLPGPVFASWRGEEKLNEDDPSFSFDVHVILGDEY